MATYYNGPVGVRAGNATAGTRAENPYTNEFPYQEMPNQEEQMSCSAACARKLLHDRNLDVSEPEIRALAFFHPTHGIDPFDLANALQKLYPASQFVGGCVLPRAGQSLEEIVHLLTSKGPWIANLHLPGKHSVIVTEIEDEVIHILDPWGANGPGFGCGTVASIALDEFLKRWQPSLHAVFPS